jgi:hypothetical protein
MYEWTPSRRAVTLGLLVACWLVLAWPWLSGSVTIPFDAKAHFQAQIQFLATALHNGESPFWTPNVFGGSPQVADPQSLIFSPAIILAALSPNPSFRSVDAFIYLLLLSGAAGIAMIFLDRKWHPVGALVASLAFAFGASAAWRIQHVGQIQSYAFFGIALWTTLRALDRRSLGWSVVAGLSAGLMIVEPDQIAYLGALVLGMIVIDWAVRSRHSGLSTGRIAAIIGAASLAGTVVIALPLTWNILFAEASNRPEVAYAEAARASLHPAALLTALVGDLFGAFDPKVEYWGPSSTTWDAKNLSLSQNMGQVYIGAVPVLALLVFGMTRGVLWSRNIRIITLSFIFCLVYGLGSLTPVFGFLFEHLPGVAVFRRPADATFMIGGLGALLAGYVIHRIASHTICKATPLQQVAEGLVIVAMLAVAGLVAWQSARLSVAIKPIAQSALWLVLGGAVIGMIARFGRSHPSAVAILVAVAMSFDLSANNGPNESTALKPSAYELLDPASTNDTIRIIKALTRQPPGSPRRDRVEFAGIGFDWPNAGMIHGFDHTLGYNPLRLDDFNEASGARDTIAGWDQKRFTALYTGYNSTFANILGLRYIATNVPIEQIDKKLQPGEMPLITRTREAMIYENRNALPRAMFVPGWKTVDFETVLDEGLPADFDPKQTVLIETQIEEGEGPALADGIAPATVRMLRYTNTEIDIEVTSKQAGFVVLNDVWHPWWRATMDGNEVEILKANIIFRAVQVAAGKHLVHFEFKPIEGAISELRDKIAPKKGDE